MIVGIDETGDDGHSLGVEGLRPLADERPHVGAAADRGESRAGNRERFRARLPAIDCIDLRVVDDQVRVDGCERSEGSGEDAGSGETHEFPACP